MRRCDTPEYTSYPFAVVPFTDDGLAGFRAFLIDIPAVESLGLSIEEAIEGLGAAQDEWFAYARAHDIGIPEPDSVFSPSALYSGRVTLRLPKSLHRQAAERAALEGVSLNTFLNAAILKSLSA
jgi:antitoxin HicB